jgi:predicted RNase H-like nuclease (RuvC/YqgF family)
MPDPKENRKARAEMISKSHREGDIQTLAKAIVNLYDHIEDLERKLDAARRKISDLESKLDDLA